MWHWDQGRLEYFQFDNLRIISSYVTEQDFKAAPREQLFAATGLSFQAPSTHSPWRNYSRVLKLCLLVSERDGVAEPTPIAALLARPGATTSDEYLHFLAQASTEPNPALTNWNPCTEIRYPLLFSLKYLLAKAATANHQPTSIDEIIGAYRVSGFTGEEGQFEFTRLAAQADDYEEQGRNCPGILRRQASESIRVLCQISYLYLTQGQIRTSLARQDADDIFQDLAPISGLRENSRDAEIRRLAQLFGQGTVHEFFEFPNTVLSDVVESGFIEGTKVEKTHITIERNSGLRMAFFAQNPTSVCDVCRMDTHVKYPWTQRILDLHHLLPLASGARVESSGTTLNDLVPLCPTCHRSVHRFYGDFFRNEGRRDFTSRAEAITIYGNVKNRFRGIIHA